MDKRTFSASVQAATIVTVNIYMKVVVPVYQFELESR